MEQNNIKKNMSGGIWVHEKVNGCKDILSNNGALATCFTHGIEDDKVDIANASAICHAINNTYGLSINPEAVHDMFKKLDKIANQGSAKPKDIKEIKEILTKAQL